MSEASSSTSPAIPEVEVIDLTQTDSSSSDEGEDEGSEEDAVSSTELSADEEFVMDENTRAQLHVAIATTPASRLRQVVAMMVDSSPDIELAAARHLVTCKRNGQRTMPRYQVCANCENEFDTRTAREDEECRFHPGELECNYEAFVDWDEDCHGEMDCEETRREYPENFNWTCCDQDGRSPGCVKSRHTADSPNKRRRL